MIHRKRSNFIKTRFREKEATPKNPRFQRNETEKKTQNEIKQQQHNKNWQQTKFINKKWTEAHTSREKKFLTVISLAYLLELIKMLNKFSSGYAYISNGARFAQCCSRFTQLQISENSVEITFYLEKLLVHSFVWISLWVSSFFFILHLTAVIVVFISL